MKRSAIYLLLLIVAFCVACRAQEASSPANPRSLPPIEVHFSPGGGCTEAVVKELDAAKKTIQVQAYSFTSVPIAKALVEAHKRGVKVEVVLDKSQRTEKYSEADFLVHMGIPTRIDTRHAIAHNKVMVIDGECVITGSFNFTKAAELSNAENLLVIRSAELATKYADNWEEHADHSDPYAGKVEGYSQTHGPTGQVDPVASAVVTTAEGYVASKNSEVFHKAGCASAAKISPKNVIQYSTREEAVRAGKRSCRQCNP